MNDKRDMDREPTAGADATDAAKSPPAVRRPYSPPRILSREKIEGRANVCDPNVGGKAGPSTNCSIVRS